MNKTIENTEKHLDFVKHLHEWVKLDKDPEFSRAAKHLNLMLELADISDQDRSCINHDLAIIAKLAQVAAFHDGLRLGRQEAAKRIVNECRKIQ